MRVCSLRLLSAVCYRSAGLLNPLDAPHHMRASDWCRWREGVVVDRPTRQESGSYVNIGLQKVCVVAAGVSHKLMWTLRKRTLTPLCLRVSV